MTFSEFLKRLAINKYNEQYGKNFHIDEFIIKQIPSNIRTDIGCELTTIIKDDFLRLRVYLSYSYRNILDPYKVEVDGKNGIGNLKDEVYATIGEIDYNYLKENIQVYDCSSGIGDILITEHDEYFSTEDGELIALDDIFELPINNEITLNSNLTTCVDYEYTLGASVAISGDGNIIAVSSITYYYYTLGRSNTNSGFVCTFKKVNGNWERLNSINATVPVGYSDARLGKSIGHDYTGSRLVVSAPMSFRVYIYKRNGYIWVLEKTLIYDEIYSIYNDNFIAGSAFGESVAITASGDRLVIGSPFYSDNRGSMSKSNIYIYVRLGIEWILEQKIFPPLSTFYGNEDNQYINKFGTSVDIDSDGKTIVVGDCILFDGFDQTFSEDYYYVSTAGSAYVYELINGKWEESGELIGSIRTLNDKYGNCVKISGNGKTIAVGASRSNNGINHKVGAVYLFSKINNTWIQEAKIYPPMNINNIGFGGTFDFSDNGDNLYISCTPETYITDVIPKPDFSLTITEASEQDADLLVYLYKNIATQWTFINSYKLFNTDNYYNIKGNIAADSKGATIIAAIEGIKMSVLNYNG